MDFLKLDVDFMKQIFYNPMLMKILDVVEEIEKS